MESTKALASRGIKNPNPMKVRVSLFALSFAFISCTLNTEVSQDAQTGAENSLANLLEENYEALYEDASIELKNHVDEDIFLDVLKLQEKTSGKWAEAKLVNETTGTYNSNMTNIYEYELSNEAGEKFKYTAEFLKGHLLRHFIEEPDFRPEPAFVKELVGPVAALVTAEDATAIYGLLDGRYPVAQVQSLVQRIKQDVSNADSRYVYFWTDNDDNGDMMVAFVYAYEGKGYLEYRFFIKDEYPLAGIFFSPDSSAKLSE